MKYFLLFGIILMLFCGLASATTLDITLPEDGENYWMIEYADGIDITISDFLGEPLDLRLNVTTRIDDVWTLIFTRTYTDFITANGDYNIPLSESDLEQCYPFGNKEYNITVDVFPSASYETGFYACYLQDPCVGDCCDYDFNGDEKITYLDTSTFVGIPDSETATFNVTNGEQSYDYWFSFIDSNPHDLEIGASRVMTEGFKFNATSSNTNDVTLYAFLVDANKTLIAYGERDVYCNIDDGNLQWNFFVLSPDLESNEKYYEYIGIKTSGTVYDDTNTVISTDWTCFGNTKFSLDSTGNGEQLEDNWDADNDFYGIVVYFETYGEQEEGSGQSFSAFERGGNFGDIVIEYGNENNMPYFQYIIVIIIVIFCVCTPLSFAHRFDKTLPNWIYAISGIAGVYLSWGLGLIELWMILFFTLMLMLTAYLTWKERISEILHWGTPSVGEAVGESAQYVTEKAESTGITPFIRKQRKQIGERMRIGEKQYKEIGRKVKKAPKKAIRKAEKTYVKGRTAYERKVIPTIERAEFFPKVKQISLRAKKGKPQPRYFSKTWRKDNPPTHFPSGNPIPAKLRQKMKSEYKKVKGAKR